MVLDRRLAATVDEHHRLDARLDRLVDGILDERAVHHRQHFLGHRLGGGEETRAQPGDREDGLADLHAGTL
jgi:hypothetical protein